MTLEKQIEQMVHDILYLKYQVPLRCRIVEQESCEMCGAPYELNRDWKGAPNGYKTHQVGTCIRNLKKRIQELESDLDAVQKSLRDLIAEVQQ